MASQSSRPEARAAAGLQRLTNARETLDREDARARERVAELDRRLTQFSADIARNHGSRLSIDAMAAVPRLPVDRSMRATVSWSTRLPAPASRAALAFRPPRGRPVCSLVDMRLECHVYGDRDHPGPHG